MSCSMFCHQFDSGEPGLFAALQSTQYRRSRKCRQYRPRAPSRRDNLRFCCSLLESLDGVHLLAVGCPSSVHRPPSTASSHRRRPKLPIVWGGASAAFGLAPEQVPPVRMGAVVAVAGTGAVSEHHMTTTSQRDSMPARHSRPVSMVVPSTVFVFLELTMQLHIPSTSKRNRAARRPAFLMRDRGRGMFAVRCPLHGWPAVDAARRFWRRGAALPQWLISGWGAPSTPCDPIAGARRRPHRRSRGGPERQSQSARGGLLVMHVFFSTGPRGSIHRRGWSRRSRQWEAQKVRDIHVNGNGRGVAGWRFASGSWRLE